MSKANFTILKQCEHCAEMFEAQKRTTRFCSHKCNSANYKLRKRQELKKEVETETKQKLKPKVKAFDLAMIKDNHIVAAGSIQSAVEKVRNSDSNIEIEVETKTIKEVEEALVANADIIMLDNMTVDLMTEAVNLIDGKAKTEASGGITIDTIRNVAGTGVDFISVGALTHSVDAFDISQQLESIL